VTNVDSRWNVMAHGDEREGKWRGNWRMEWVASTLHTTSEHGVSSITTADAHTSAASSRLNWRPPPIWMDSSVSPKDEIWFLRVCHHISTGLYHCTFHIKRLLISTTEWIYGFCRIFIINALFPQAVLNSLSWWWIHTELWAEFLHILAISCFKSLTPNYLCLLQSQRNTLYSYHL